MGRPGMRGRTDRRGDRRETIDTSDLVGHWDWDIPNDRLYTDALVARLFGVDPVQAEDGVPLGLFLDGIHRDDRASTAAIIDRSLRSGSAYVQEYRVHSADGATRWILARGLVALDRTGRPRRGTGFLVDVTQARAAAGQVLPREFPPMGHPLAEAAEHCLAARDAIRRFPEPLLQTMTDMLLLEIGRRLSRMEERSHPDDWKGFSRLN